MKRIILTASAVFFALSLSACGAIEDAVESFEAGEFFAGADILTTVAAALCTTLDGEIVEVALDNVGEDFGVGEEIAVVQDGREKACRLIGTADILIDVFEAVETIN